MQRSEVHKILELDYIITENEICKEETELLIIIFIKQWAPHKDSISLYFIDAYNKTECTHIKEILMDYIILTLTEPKVARQKPFIYELGPLILLNPLTDRSNQNYEKIWDFLRNMTKNQDEIVIPILYKLSHLCSSMGICKNFMKYFCALDRLTELDFIVKILEKEEYWGLSGVNSIKYTKIHAAFQYKDSIPCFLDGFFEIFMLNDNMPNFNHYEECNFDERLHLSKKLNHVTDFLFKITNKLISKNDKIKKNFMSYIKLAYMSNKDIKKKCTKNNIYSSNGFLYNMYSLLRSYCSFIVENPVYKPKHNIDKLKSKSTCIYELNTNMDSFNSVNLKFDIDVGVLLEVQNENIIDLNLGVIVNYNINGTCKIVSEDNTSTINFISHMFFYKILFSELSICIFKEYIDYQLTDFNSLVNAYFNSKGEKQKQIRKKMEHTKETIEIYNIIFYSDPFKFKEEYFTEFMIAYSLKSDPLPLTYYEVLFNIKKTLVYDYRSPISNNLLQLVEILMDLNFPNENLKFDMIKIINDGYVAKYNICLLDSLAKYYVYLYKEEINYYFDTLNAIIQILNKASYVIDENMDINIDFLNAILSNFELFLFIGIDSVIKVQKIRNNIPIDIDCNEQPNEKHIDRHLTAFNNNTLKIIANASFEDFKLYLAFLTHLLHSHNNFFLKPEISYKFIQVINTSFKKILGLACMFMKSEDIIYSNFDPNIYYEQMMILYLNMQDPRFLEIIVNDTLNFNILPFKKAYNKSFIEKNVLTDEERREFNVFIGKLERINDLKKEKIPIELIDPLTWNIMKDPIKLHTSNVTIDLSTLELLMLGNKIDPFSKTVIDESKIVVDKTIALKIQEYYGNSTI